ncbi:MAG: dihydrodipicolinate synthase family protein, partial [Parachlamydiaceae bacterium]
MIYGIENGVYAAALTPLHSDLCCDNDLLTKHCLQLIERGCKGVVLFGTTGEGPSFSVEEKKSTLKQVISNGLDPKKVIIANGASSLQDTIDLGLAALESDCLAYLVAPPCFFKNVTDEGIVSFYREVIQRIPDSRLRVILYHIPQYTGVPLTLNIVKTLCTEFPDTVIG